MLAQGVVAAARSLTRGNPRCTPYTRISSGAAMCTSRSSTTQRFRDGKSFANRQVTAMQDGEELCTMLVAFQDNLAGLEHAVRIPEVPHPEELPTMGEQFAGFEDKIATFVDALHPIDVRFANDPSWKLREAGRSLDHNRVWMKTDGPLPDDPVLHVAAMCYASRHHGARLDHHHARIVGIRPAVRRHRQPFDVVPPRVPVRRLVTVRHRVTGGGRCQGLGWGRFWTREGVLAASVTQEALIRHFPGKLTRAPEN